jgi:hypothetical protein
LAIRRRRKTLTNLLSTIDRRVSSVELRPISLLTTAEVNAAVATPEPLNPGPDTIVGGLTAPNQYRAVTEGYYYPGRMTGSAPRVELYFTTRPGIIRNDTIRISGIHNLIDGSSAVGLAISGDFKTLSSDSAPWDDRPDYNGVRHTPGENVLSAVLFDPNTGTEYSDRKPLIVKSRIAFTEATTTTAKITFTSTNYFKVGDAVYVEMPQSSSYFGIDGLFRVKEVGSNFITFDFSSEIASSLDSAEVTEERYVYAVAQAAVRDGATWIDTRSDVDTVYVWKDIRWVTYSTGDVTRDTLAPAPITALSASNENDTPDGNAIGLSRITLTWTAPTTNSDGSALDDLIGYTIWWRQFESQEWSKVDMTGPETTWSATGFEQGLNAYFRVYARDSGGNLSTGVGISHAVNRSTPAIFQPSLPTVTTYLGTIKVAYDDTTTSGNEQADTAKEVEVYFDRNENFVPGPDSYYGKFAAGNLSYIIIPGTDEKLIGADGVDLYFRIIVRDIYGNITAPSDPPVSVQAKLSDIVTYDMIDVGTLRGRVIIGADIRTSDNPSTGGGIILNEQQLIAYNNDGEETFRIAADDGSVSIGSYLGKEEAAGLYIAEGLANETFATKVTAQAIELTANTANTNATNAQAAADTADDKAADALTRIEAGTITVTSEFRNRAISAINLNTEPSNTTTINGGSIKTGTVEATAIKAGTLDVGVVYSGTISADKINTGTLNASVVSVTNLDAGNITTGTISSGRINSDSISAASVNADKITSGTIAAARITSDSISSGVVSATKITAGTLAGRTVRTTNDALGLRVELSGGTNEVRFMSGVNTVGYLTGLTGSELFINGTAGLGLRLQGGSGGVDIGSTTQGTVDIRGDLDIDTIQSSTGTNNFIGVSSTGRVRRHTTTFTSDARVKKNIQELPLGVDFLTKLNPISYVLKHDVKGETKYGLIAQEVEEALKSYDIPSTLVNTEFNEKYSGLDSNEGDDSYIRRIDYIQLIPILINSISELSDRINVLEKERDQNNGN